MNARPLLFFAAHIGDQISFEFRANGKFELLIDEIVNLLIVDSAENENRAEHAGGAQRQPFFQS